VTVGWGWANMGRRRWRRGRGGAAGGRHGRSSAAARCEARAPTCCRPCARSASSARSRSSRATSARVRAWGAAAGAQRLARVRLRGGGGRRRRPSRTSAHRRGATAHARPLATPTRMTSCQPPASPCTLPCPPPAPTRSFSAIVRRWASVSISRRATSICARGRGVGGRRRGDAPPSSCRPAAGARPQQRPQPPAAPLAQRSPGAAPRVRTHPALRVRDLLPHVAQVLLHDADAPGVLLIGDVGRLELLLKALRRGGAGRRGGGAGGGAERAPAGRVRVRRAPRPAARRAPDAQQRPSSPAPRAAGASCARARGPTLMSASSARFSSLAKGGRKFLDDRTASGRPAGRGHAGRGWAPQAGSRHARGRVTARAGRTLGGVHVGGPPPAAAPDRCSR
jgi:hypothetical protein